MAAFGQRAQICFDQRIFLTFIIIIIGLIGYYHYETFSQLSVKNYNNRTVHHYEQSTPNIVEHVKFPAHLNNPYIPPVKEGRYDLSHLGYHTNIRTRNGDENYHRVGIVYNGSKRFTLFGRNKYGNMHDYYVLDNNKMMNKIKLKNKKELYTDDNVTIPTYDEEYTVHIYDYDNDY